MPLENINVTSKKFKLDSRRSLPVIGTLKSKDESLETILQTAVTKFKQEKQANGQKLQAPSRQEQYKQKTTSCKKASSKQTAKTAALHRYQIVNKARGITPLDAEAESYLMKSDRLSLNLPDGAKELSEAASSETSDVATPSAEDIVSAAQGEGARMIPLQFLDVEHCSVRELNNKQEDVICMNGIPLERSYVYDIFITRVPKGYSVEEFLIRDLGQGQLEDNLSSDDELGNDSDDSNAENNYRNDYPDAEESDMNESGGEGSDYYLSDQEGVAGTSQYWGDNVVDQMAHCSLGDDSSESVDEENGVFLGGEPIPSQYKSLFRLSKAVLRQMKRKDHDSDSEDSGSNSKDSGSNSEDSGSEGGESDNCSDATGDEY